MTKEPRGAGSQEAANGAALGLKSVPFFHIACMTTAIFRTCTFVSSSETSNPTYWPIAVLLGCRCPTSSRSYQTLLGTEGSRRSQTHSFAWRECVGCSSGARAITPCRVVGDRLAVRQAQKTMQ